MADFPTIEYAERQIAFDYESYDKAAARLFNPLRIVGSDNLPSEKPIPLTFATPERAWGVMRVKFQKQIEQDKNFVIPLPFISLQQMGDTAYDPRRYVFKKTLYRKVALSSDFTTCLSHPHPLPFTFQYSAELWCKTRYEARVHVAQFAQLWDEGGLLYRNVDHGLPMGVKKVPFFLEGITDNTGLETGDQQRTMRWTFSFRVEGWLPPPLIEQKLVHALNVSIEAPASLCEENPYEDAEVAGFYPLHRGNPETGEIVTGDEEFDPNYSGVDYRLSRFSSGNPCVEV